MVERRHPLLNGIAGVAVAVALALAGYWLLLTTFMLYDDEGYVLMSLRNYIAHGALYDEVYTQYGPFPYVLYDSLQRVLPFEFTNVAGRWITLVNWLLAAGASALLVIRTTRSVVWSTFTAVGVFTYLWVMINEPIHPGGLVASLLAGGAWLGAELWASGRVRVFAIAMALIGTALALTKINVGAFYLAAVAAWMAVNAAPLSLGRRLAWLVALACAILPVGLMSTLFAETWVRLYALVFVGAALSCLLVARQVARPVVGMRIGGSFLLAAAIGAAAICGPVLLRGTSFSGLLNGVLLEPLRHPGVYFFAMNWRLGTGVLALAALAFAAWTAHRRLWEVPWFRETIAWARVLAGGVFLCTPLQIIPTSMAAWGMCYGVSLAWLCAVPLQDDRRGAATRAWLALLLVMQFLQAYPVAGSQLNWGTFLWVPLLALGLSDAGPVLRARCRQLQPWVGWLGLGAVAVTTIFTAARLCWIGWDRFSTSQPLRLAGAESLRLPDDITSDVRIVTENLRAHADLLFSLPGAFSTNLWSGLPPPTLANVTHWFSLLNPQQQEAIRQRLADSPRAALLVQRDSVDYLLKHGFTIGGPLPAWLMEHFRPVLKVDGYEIWLKAGRTIAPLSTAKFEQRAESDITLTLTWRAPPVAVTGIELRDLDRSGSPVHVFGPRDVGLTITPCSLDGAQTGASTTAQLPFVAPEISRVKLHFAKPVADLNWSRTLVVLRDAGGKVLGEARVVR